MGAMMLEHNVDAAELEQEEIEAEQRALAEKKEAGKQTIAIIKAKMQFEAHKREKKEILDKIKDLNLRAQD